MSFRVVRNGREPKEQREQSQACLGYAESRLRKTKSMVRNLPEIFFLENFKTKYSWMIPGYYWGFLTTKRSAMRTCDRAAVSQAKRFWGDRERLVIYLS